MLCGCPREDSFRGLWCLFIVDGDAVAGFFSSPHGVLFLVVFVLFAAVVFRLGTVGGVCRLGGVGAVPLMMVLSVQLL